MFTRKHYKAVAEIIKEAKEDLRGGTPAELVLDAIERQFTDYFDNDNPNFNRWKFYWACELKEYD